MSTIINFEVNIPRITQFTRSFMSNLGGVKAKCSSAAKLGALAFAANKIATRALSTEKAGDRKFCHGTNTFDPKKGSELKVKGHLFVCEKGPNGEIPETTEEYAANGVSIHRINSNDPSKKREYPPVVMTVQAVDPEALIKTSLFSGYSYFPHDTKLKIIDTTYLTPEKIKSYDEKAKDRALD